MIYVRTSYRKMDCKYTKGALIKQKIFQFSDNEKIYSKIVKIYFYKLN